MADPCCMCPVHPCSLSIQSVNAGLQKQAAWWRIAEWKEQLWLCGCRLLCGTPGQAACLERAYRELGQSMCCSLHRMAMPCWQALCAARYASLLELSCLDTFRLKHLSQPV